MTTPTNCPDCAEDLRPNATRCKCGWILAKIGRSTATTERDPRLCGEMTDALTPCPNVWVWKRGGRCYCHAHDPFGPVAKKDGVEHFQSIREIMKRAAPKPRDREAEAEREAIQGEK